LCYRFVCCLAEPDHMITIFGGIGRLRVRPSFVSQLVRIHLLYGMLTLFCGECEFAQAWLYCSIRNRTWNIIDMWRLYRRLLNGATVLRAVLLNFITCDENLAESDVRAYVHLSSLSLYVWLLLYSPLTLFRWECEFGQRWLYYSIRNRTWNIIDLWRLYRCLLNGAIVSRAVLLNLITW